MAVLLIPPQEQERLAVGPVALQTHHKASFSEQPLYLSSLPALRDQSGHPEGPRDHVHLVPSLT